MARANFRPIFLPVAPQTTSTTKAVYDILTIVVTFLTVNYATTPFMLGNLHDSLVSWSLVGWYGHILIISALIFFYAGGAKMLKGLHGPSGEKANEKKAHANGQTNGNGKVGGENLQLPPPIHELVPPPAGMK